MRAALTSWLCLALVASAPAAAWASPPTVAEREAAAHAEADQAWRVSNAFSWGIVATELLLTTSLTLRFTLLRGDISEAADGTLWTIPPLLGSGLGVAEYWVRAPGWLAYALHGGLWTGLLGGLLASLVHATFEEGPGMRFETPALVALLASTVPGLWIGATKIDAPDEVGPWMGLPPAGLLAGIVVAGVVLVGSFVVGEDPGPRAGDQLLGWCFFGATSVGLSAAVASVM